MIRGVLFDLDNTLIDRDAAFHRFCHEYLEDAFPHLEDWERSQAWTYMIARDRRTLMCEGHPFVLQEQMVISTIEAESETILPEWHSQICSDEWDVHKRSRLAQLIEPDPVVEQLIQRLRFRFRLAVVTNGSGTIQRAKLEATGMAHLFEHIVVSGEFGVSKPDPLIFEAALSRLRCRPEEALFVGDDPVCDMVGAKRVGLQTAWVNGGREWCEILDGRGNPVLERPDYSINHVSQLEESITCLMRNS